MSLQELARPPIISTSRALVACGLYTASYVGGLYLSSSSRGDRDDPAVIRGRLKVASASSLLSLLGAGYLLRSAAPPPLTFFKLLRILGLALPAPSFLSSALIPTSPPLAIFLRQTALSALGPFVLTALLYLGPIYISYLDGELPLQRHFSFARDVRDKMTSLSGVRNYLLGPLTEELVFRGCVLSTLFFAGASRTQLIFCSPLWFGAAHLHHAYATYVGYGRTPAALAKAAAQAALQFAYTGIFGWYASFLFLRTGTVLGPFVAHVFCNVMGLPNPAAAAEDHPRKSRWIHLAHFAGVVAFAKCLYSLTQPAWFGGSIYWE